MILNSHSVAGLACAALLIGCGGDGGAGGWAGTIDTLANGAVHVVNPQDGLWQDEEAWTVVEDLRIGSIEATGPEGFGSIAGIGQIPQGGVVVLDRQYHELRAFDRDGRHLWTAGRQGGGPGEFQDPIGLIVEPDGRIRVADPSGGRYSIFDPDGTFVGTLPRMLGGYSLPWRAAIDDNGRFREIGFTAGSSALLTVDSTGIATDSVRLPERRRGDSFTHSGEDFSISAAVPFAASEVLVWDRRGHFWVGETGAYRITQLTEAGDTVRIIERPGLSRTPVTPAERSEAIEGLEWFTSQGGRIDPARIPNEKPYFRTFHVDDGGRLWVLRTTAAADTVTRFDLFDSDGRFLGRLPTFTDFGSTPIFDGDHIWGTSRDSLGVQYIVRGRIVRGKPGS